MVADTSLSSASLLPSSQRAGASSSQASFGEIDFFALFALVWRRKFIVLLITLIGFAVSYFLMGFAQPRYAAHSVILIGSDSSSSAQGVLQGLVPRSKFDDSLVGEALQIMSSREMARMLVTEMNLTADPEFAGDEAVAQGARPQSFKSFAIGEQDFAVNENNTRIEQTISAFLNHLRVIQVPGARAIKVRFVSRNPHKAANIANEVAQRFIDQRRQKMVQLVDQAAQMVDERLVGLQTEIQDLGRQIDAYKKANDLDQNLVGLKPSEHLAKLERLIIVAETERADIEAKLAHVRSLDLKRVRVDNLPSLLESSQIQFFKNETARLQKELSDLSVRYGARHPRIIQVNEELALLKQTARDEIGTVIRDLESEQAFATARINSLRAQLKDLSDVHEGDYDVLKGLHTLESQLELKERAYDKMVQGYQFDINGARFDPLDMRIISRAVPSYASISPQTSLIVGLGTFLFFVFGLVFVVLLEAMDRSFRSASQLEERTGADCYALIPSAPKRFKSLVQSGLYVVKEPRSVIAESVRTLRTALSLRNLVGRGAPKVVSVTSSFSGEGKTALCSWLGRSAALSGERVIVIDCDMRSPNLHNVMGGKAEVTIVDYLTGQASLEDIVQKDTETGMHMIYAQAVPNTAANLLSSERMKALISALREAYDLVIIDTPPCLAISDARILSTVADITLYGVSWGKTPRHLAVQGVKQFRDIGAPLASVLMNVDVRRYVRYGYGDVVYYYSDDSKV